MLPALKVKKDRAYKFKRKYKFNPKVVNSLIKQGHTQRETAKVVGVSEATICLYLKGLEEQKGLQRRADKLQKQDIKRLGLKARVRLNDRIDQDQLTNIELIALMDRAFGQQRLLEGKSTQIVDGLTAIVRKAAELDSPVFTK